MLLRARFLLAAPGQIIENGAVLLAGARVARSGAKARVATAARARTAPVVDLGDAVLMPGLVNAHVHLDLSAAAGRFQPTTDFSAWLAGVVAFTRATPHAALAAAAREAARGMLADGTTGAGDIVSSRLMNDAAVALSGLRVVLFREVLGFDPARAEETMEEALALSSPYDHAAFPAEPSATRPAPPWASRTGGARPSAPPLATCGLSPHAPYSTSERLYRLAAIAAAERGWPLSTHVAETRAEEEFLARGSGPLADLLRSVGVSLNGWKPPAVSPVEHLSRIGALDAGPLLAHLNYPRERDLDTIAASRCAVVYCPRSHAFFGHEPHPVRRLLDMGVPVCIGTDSLASNESLSLWDEARFLRKTRSDLAPDEILRMMTAAPARALGFLESAGGQPGGPGKTPARRAPGVGARNGEAAGLLRPGAPADLIARSVPAGLPAREVSDFLTSQQHKNLLTLVGGRVQYRAAGITATPSASPAAGH
ncbi:MAG: amidohydrolase family protein [Planctomycetes bacterium]|nr:amidohydrolase family protein [Planctomycetota bacterium]